MRHISIISALAFLIFSCANEDEQAFVKGIVTNGTSPVDNATINISAGIGTYSGVTDVNGFFQVEVAPSPNTYSLLIGKEFSDGKYSTYSDWFEINSGGVKDFNNLVLPEPITLSMDVQPNGEGIDVTLSWNAFPDVVEYKVFSSENPVVTQTSTLIYTGKQTTLTFKRSPDFTIYYRVFARNSDNNIVGAASGSNTKVYQK